MDSKAGMDRLMRDDWIYEKDNGGSVFVPLLFHWFFMTGPTPSPADGCDGSERDVGVLSQRLAGSVY